MTMSPQDQAAQANQAASSASHVKHEFMCEKGDCTDHSTAKGQVAKIGRKYATALAGFIAGVIVASMVLYPWLHFLGKLCPSVGK